MIKNPPPITEKNWRKRLCNESLRTTLQHELGVSPLCANVLATRSVVDVQDAREFLEASLKSLFDPLLLKDMDLAITRIEKALLNKEIIGVFGDYDVDGVCSAAVLQEFLESINAQVVATLPNRMTEGYGLSKPGIMRLRDRGATLVIAVDCGITAHESVDYANSLNLDVIVVDHHTVPEQLPKATAIINPKRPDCASQASYLCAAGVTFFLVLGLRRRLREINFFIDKSEPDVKNLLDFVALATVCDVVPLIKDNRALVKAGLRVLKEGKRVSLRALMEASLVDCKKISSTNLGFHLGPRINAAGRLDDAAHALTLLRSHDAEFARSHARALDEMNQERRVIEEDTVQEICALIERDAHFHDAAALVLHDERWHPGVVGIVASRIAERFHKPAIIIGEKGKGSGRSIKGIDLHEMVSRSSTSLVGFGGHAYAIGITLGERGVEPFRRDLLIAMQTVPAHVYRPEIFYDADVNLSTLDLSMVDELSRLEPFGAHNPYPVLRINNVSLRNLRRLEKGHIKGELESSQGFISFIGFRMSISDELASETLDVLGILEKNEWQNRITLQLRLIDFKKAIEIIPSSHHEIP